MYRGDIRLGSTVDLKFTTRSFTTGAPTTLAGSPVISAYVDNGTTEITAGITLSVDFDSRTGLHNVRVVATSGNGFATATNVDLVITTGTVGGVSVVGEVIGSFSIEARSALMPTTAARTLDVSAGGEGGVDWANVGSPTTTLALTGTTIATTQKVDVETIKTNPVVNGGTITFPTTATLASTTNITAGTVTTATNVTTVNGLAANVITAASMAADASAEIADAVWDEDATGHQTQGTFGQAIGDPGADADTIWALANTNLDAAVSSRMATYTQPTGFLAATFPSGTVANTTNITAGTITTATNVTTVNGLAAGVVTATAIADAAIDRATFAADTGLQSIRSNTAQAGAAGSITLDASASASNDFYTGALVLATGGTGVGQCRVITAYVGATKVATVFPSWTTNPDSSTTFAVLPASYVQGVVNAVDATIDPAEIANAVWDEAIAGHLSAGSTGLALNSAGAAGDPWSTAIPGAYGAGTAGFIVGTNLDATVSSRPTAAAIATAVWQDATGGDFTVASSIGKALYINNVAPGGTGGHFISGSNAGTTTFGAFTVTGTTTFAAISASNVALSGTLTVNAFTCTNAFTVSGNWLTTGTTTYTGAITGSNASNNLRINGIAPGAAGGLFIAGTNAATTITGSLTTTFTGNLTGSVDSVTGDVGGSVNGNVAGTIGGLSVGAATDVGGAVWDAVLADHLDAGSTGFALNAAGSAGDPWGTALPGAYGAGTAGKIIGSLVFTVANVLDANVQYVNDIQVKGVGTAADPWNPV